MEKYWNDKLLTDLRDAESFEELFMIALSIIKGMPSPVVQVCGPITSGGAGSTEKNLTIFENTIRQLQSSGLNVFDQLPFEEPMFRIKKSPYYKEGDHLLETFYLPIFESGYIRKLYFISNWQSSYGAQWEHNQALRLGIEIIYLEK